jgi:hypothetical protein
MWTRAKTVPIIIGTLRTFKNGLDQNLQSLLGHPSATELQKIILIIRKVRGKPLWSLVEI